MPRTNLPEAIFLRATIISLLQMYINRAVILLFMELEVCGGHRKEQSYLDQGQQGVSHSCTQRGPAPAILLNY